MEPNENPALPVEPAPSTAASEKPEPANGADAPASPAYPAAQTPPSVAAQSAPPRTRRLIMRPVVIKNGKVYTRPPLRIPEKKISRFGLIFGENPALGFFTIASAALCVVWLMLYGYLVLERNAQFTQAIETMAMQGFTEYTVKFQSPMLLAERVLLYVLPIFALGWAGVVAYSSNRGQTLGKKSILVAVLLAFLLVGLVSAVDIAAVGLVFDVAKT